MTGDEVLFECDFSVDELAVLADLLEIPALPGGDPDLEFSEDAKAAAARGLLARGVVVANGPAGTVEITQPYATMIGIVLFAKEAGSYDDGSTLYRTEDGDLQASPQPASGMVRWAVRPAGSLVGGAKVATAKATTGRVEIEHAPST